MQRRILVVLVCALLPLLSCSKVAQWFISDQQEIEMGGNFRAEIEADSANFPLYENRAGYNPALVKYIDSIGNALANAQNDRDTIPFHFTIVDQDTVINAFAVPGGFIYIYTGLIKAARSEDEIAGVLAHEIGHVTKRHGVNQLVKKLGYDFVLDLVVGEKSGLRTALDLAGGFVFLKYGRKDEYQADSCSMEYTYAAGYNPYGMKSFLDLLDSSSGGNSWGVLSTVLSTHPPSDERADSVEVLIKLKHSSVQPNSPAPRPKRVSP